MQFDLGFGLPTYLAHLTIGVGRHTLWLNIIANNWKWITFTKERGDYFGRFSIFAFAYTRERR